MSENMAYSHFTRPDAPRFGYVGHANPGVECRIGENGELLVKSPAQMLGYYKEPERRPSATRRMASSGRATWARSTKRGGLRITGRVKDLFKTTKGKYVAPVPIENRLERAPQGRSGVRVRRQSRLRPTRSCCSRKRRERRSQSGFPREALGSELSRAREQVNAA